MTEHAGTRPAHAQQAPGQQLPDRQSLPQRVLTVPNVISLARLAGVPVFVWLVLGLRSQAGDWWAVGLLVAAGVSDWLDGKIARAWNQQSRLGEMLDPVADRLYIVATVTALAIRVIIPWWLVGVLAARELVLGVVLVALWHGGYGPLKVSFVGKAATLSLLYAFPLLFLGSHPTSYSTLARVFGWAFALWGTALYWWAAVLYAEQARRLLAVSRPSGRRDVAACLPSGGDGDQARDLRGGAIAEPEGSAGNGEGHSHGRRRGHQAAPDDRQPAQAAAAGGQQADHGARAQPAPQA